MKPKNIAILGSTGSIGRQALEVVKIHPSLFTIDLLTAGSNVDLLLKQAQEFRPRAVIIENSTHFKSLKEALSSLKIEVYTGSEAVLEQVQSPDSELILTSMVGYAGLLPTIKAIEARKNIALANKETLVVAGELIMNLARKNGVQIIPVDSEHSAIFQCLVGEKKSELHKIILTASGGPFRGKKRHELEKITPEQALKHPNWSMGSKITIDSATLMNKGLEVIEAKWLFDWEAENIEVVVHPQSIIHSLVEFSDGSLKAQLGLPDMRLPIQYALCFPERMSNGFARFNFLDYSQFTFESPDQDTFACLGLAFQALKDLGTKPCVLNAANEIAVEAFLQEKIGFLQIPELIQNTMEKVPHISHPTLEDYIQTNLLSRKIATDFFRK